MITPEQVAAALDALGDYIETEVKTVKHRLHARSALALVAQALATERDAFVAYQTEHEDCIAENDAAYRRAVAQALATTRAQVIEECAALLSSWGHDGIANGVRCSMLPAPEPADG